MPSPKTFLIVAALQLMFVGLSNGWLYNDGRCYPNIGCFPTNGHFRNSIGFAPQSPSSIGVTFVYKGRNGGDPFSVEDTQQQMQDVYDPSLKTIVIIHGYKESHTVPWIDQLVDALETELPSQNIFIVDWEAGARRLNYLKSVANTRVVGAVTARFLQKLIQLGAYPSSFHIIGFSLGAHVAGYAGEIVHGIGRITGLDPAGPRFRNTHPSVRLDPTDADLVDVVHTNRLLGIQEPCGTVDFYPNGGAVQPSCNYGAMQSRFMPVISLGLRRIIITETILCHHMRAPQLFISSILQNCNYNLMKSPDAPSMRSGDGTWCTDGTCPTFGYHLNSDQLPRPGIYRFQTGGSHPYCFNRFTLNR